MAESKVDYSQLIGFLFLMAAFVSFLFISPPSDEEIEGARKLLDSISKNQDSGVGVFVNEKGDIVDAAMIRRAKEILNFIEKL